MGWVVHHAILVTVWGQEAMTPIVAKARAIFARPDLSAVPSPPQSPAGTYWTLCIPPDGADEGDVRSAQGNARRAAFRAFVLAMPVMPRPQLVEVAYGETAPVLTHAQDAQIAGAGIELWEPEDAPAMIGDTP
jgi:hypothetical protein